MSADGPVSQDMAGAHSSRHAWQKLLTNDLYLSADVEYS